MGGMPALKAPKQLELTMGGQRFDLGRCNNQLGPYNLTSGEYSPIEPGFKLIKKNTGPAFFKFLRPKKVKKKNIVGT